MYVATSKVLVSLDGHVPTFKLNVFTVSNMQLISTIFWCSVDFIHREIRKVVEKIGPELVVQIVTDNGSNYKKACEKLIEEYKHIFWQPCAAHTINLMLIVWEMNARDSGAIIE